MIVSLYCITLQYVILLAAWYYTVLCYFRNRRETASTITASNAAFVSYFLSYDESSTGTKFRLVPKTVRKTSKHAANNDDENNENVKRR